MLVNAMLGSVVCGSTEESLDVITPPNESDNDGFGNGPLVTGIKGVC